MTNAEALDMFSQAGVLSERRAEPREPITGTLWMIDHNGSTVLRCQCVESSANGMRLRVPLGYGIADGQRYELRSRLPGGQSTEGFGIVGSRWATVVRTQVCVHDEDDHLDVGVLLDTADRPPISLVPAVYDV